LPTLDRLFGLAGNIVTPVWLLLIFAPRWRWTQRLATFAVPLLLAGLYGFLLLHGNPLKGSGFATLAQISQLFALPQVLLAGWVHYLAFDLFTGSWEARDAARLGISPWLVAPCLVLTFLLGPLGLALDLLLRLMLRKEVGA